MHERYISPAFNDFSHAEAATAPLSGVEAAIYDRLWRSIVEGKLKAGVKLREDVIGEVFSVSRTPVRKVLVILEQEGMVCLPPNHGAYVATISPTEARDAYEAMLMSMVHIVSKLSEADFKLTAHDRDLIERHIAAQAEAEERGDFAASRLLSAEYSILLALIHGNTILTDLISNLAARLTMATVLYQVPLSHPPRVSLQKNILNQILAQDQAGVVATIENAFASFFKTLRFEIEEDDPDLRSILVATSEKPLKAPMRPRHARRSKQSKA